MAILGQLLCNPGNFQIFKDRLGTGLKDDLTAPILVGFQLSSWHACHIISVEMWYISLQLAQIGEFYHAPNYYTNVYCHAQFFTSTVYYISLLSAGHGCCRSLNVLFIWRDTCIIEYQNFTYYWMCNYCSEDISVLLKFMSFLLQPSETPLN